MITIGSVFALILIGSIVRSMGAGMGCPDWPKCFGSYVPPTSHNQLPENYLDVFKEKRLSKNHRLASMFQKIGYAALADKILNDPFVQEEQSFDVKKAWIEYINRLVGVLIGFFVLLNMVLSFSFKKNRWIPFAGVCIFVLTGFQGWVGSLVVSTNLLKGFITFHMLLALLIVALLIWMNVKARQVTITKDSALFYIVTALIILFVPQIILGTEVRATVDPLLVSEPDRTQWASTLARSFFVHRSYSWLILIGVLLVFYWVRKKGYHDLKWLSTWLVSAVILIAIAGIVMVKFSFPFWVQPIHLLLAAGIFGLLFYFVLRLKPA
ncbi:MAG: COX15/CtaA family protein [Bacteroidota bacterium]